MNIDEHWTTKKPVPGKWYWFGWRSWHLTPYIQQAASEPGHRWREKTKFGYVRSILPIPDPVPPPLPKEKP